MTDNPVLVSTPLVQVVLPDGDRTFPFGEIAIEGDDPATISDSDLMDRCRRWLDLPAGSLSNYTVQRRTTGNVLVSPRPTFGG